MNEANTVPGWHVNSNDQTIIPLIWVLNRCPHTILIYSIKPIIKWCSTIKI